MQHRRIPTELPPLAKGGEGGFETRRNPPQSVRRHSPSTDAGLIMAALDGGAPFSKGGG